MTTFFLDGQAFDSAEDESVLETLIRSGNSINYSCKKGACKTCLVQHVGGELSPGSQRGLSARLKANHYLCTCQCQPTEGLKLKTVIEQDLFVSAQLVERIFMTESVMKVVIKLSENLDCYAGQYINLRRFDGLTRSYAIAKVFDDNVIELHITRKYNGQFSGWLFSTASIGEQLLIQGPLGQCIYKAEYHQDKLILIGHGAGIGAVMGIVEQALDMSHQADIYLYHGARTVEELYLHKKCLSLMLAHKNVHYRACITATAPVDLVDKRCLQIQPFELAAKEHPINRHNRVFLCGEPEAVVKAQQQAFLDGFEYAKIHVLPFEYKDLRTVKRA
ncbi:2Fe-2S iron-sulfur cluster-binding protein [Shewanella sp. GutDb-MelDb]|uniref:2Fe-2S iron-sulfur cluster-binding protein n=1 Tax=Shewanella sp. GutDb-MelDb TaxID=2058316 RepID=UPI000C799E02|nr:2Fe-2S iron-sulfur cluster-binding protein [Shewanella sp. GutDb-MelDb]PKG58405.1 oxidoreductase [Shewanella sp. GutDb-MelDb]